MQSEVAAKERELTGVKGRLEPFEAEEAAIKDLQKLGRTTLDIEFGTTSNFDGVSVIMEPRKKDLDWNFAPGDGFEQRRRIPPILDAKAAEAVESLAKVRRLSTVTVRHLVLSPSQASSLASRPGLESVTYGNSGIDQASLAACTAPPSLKWIHVPVNKFTSLDGLPVMDSVVGLNLAHNPIGDGGLTRIAQLFPRLKHLNLSGTKITDQVVANLTGLPFLISINLQDTATTESLFIALGACERLNVIHPDKSRSTESARKHYESKKRLMQFLSPSYDIVPSK